MKRDATGFLTSAIIGRRHIMLTAFISLSVILAALLILPTPFNLLPFVIICGIGFLFLSIKFPMIGIMIYMLIYFVRPQELFPGVALFSYPYEKIVAIIVIMNLILDYAVNGKKIKILKMDLAIVGILGAAFLSIMTAIWISWAWMEFQKFFKIVIVYFFITRLVDSPDKFKWIVWLYVISTGFIAVSSTMNYYSGNYQTAMGINRAVGLGEGGAYGDPNTMATTLVLGLPFMFYLAKAYRRALARALLFALIPICLWTVIITGSRGGMLGAAFIMFVLAWNTRQKVAATVAVLLLIIGALLVMPEQYTQRLTTIFHIDSAYDESGAAESAQGRIKGLKVGFEILINRPPAGAGIGCFSLYNREHHGSSLNAHNLLGQVMGDLGFLGLIAFGFLVYMMVRHYRYIKSLYKSRNWERDFNFYVSFAAIISVIALFFQGVFGHNAYRFNWYIYACFLAVVVGLVEQRRKAEEAAIPEPRPDELSILFQETP